MEVKSTRGTTIRNMSGIAGEKPLTVHISHGHNQFETVVTPVPAGYYKDDDFSNEWAIEYHCRNPNPIPTTGKNVEDWIEESKIKWLTIADINNIPSGQSIQVLVVDRNFGDTLEATATPNKPMIPSELLAFSKATFTRTHDLQGNLVLHCAEDEDIDLGLFEFDVSVPSGWYPLHNGVLPSEDSQGFLKLYGKSMRWQDMPPHTHVGYRGPMIPWSVVTEEKSLLFWHNP